MNLPLTLAQEATESTKSVLDYIQSGGIVGYTILLLSVAAISLWIYLWMILRVSRQAPAQDVDSLSRLLRDGNVPDAVRFCDNHASPNFLTRMFGGALKRCQRSQLGLLEFRSAIEEGGQREVERLYRTVDWVALIAAVGPMLGLLGTVFGMIGAFGAISKLEGAARSKELANFMSLALVATALGLIVAIPCTAVFSVARRRIDEMAEQIAQIAESLAAELSSRLSPGGPARAVPGARPPVAPRPQVEQPREVRTP